jgi:mRNA-degrading endonuclease RelE of RelBE toxin-antitoxin system
VNFSLEFQPEAKAALLEIERDNQKKYRKVLKTLGLMQTNLRHPGLNTHKYNEYKGPKGEDIFESYVENRTPGAFRVFWYYGSQKGVITVVAITPHP